jgi:hypothetical protein
LDIGKNYHILEILYNNSDKYKYSPHITLYNRVLFGFGSKRKEEITLEEVQCILRIIPKSWMNEKRIKDLILIYTRRNKHIVDFLENYKKITQNMKNLY